MLKSLRPAYVGPTYNDMSNKLLNLAYDNVIDDGVKEEVQRR